MESLNKLKKNVMEKVTHNQQDRICTLADWGLIIDNSDHRTFRVFDYLTRKNR